MSGYVNDLLGNFINYFNAFFNNPLIMYIAGMYIVLFVIGLLRKLIKVNS